MAWSLQICLAEKGKDMKHILNLLVDESGNTTIELAILVAAIASLLFIVFGGLKIG